VLLSALDHREFQVRQQAVVIPKQHQVDFHPTFKGLG
jgi:hypothetical protein